MSERCVVTGGAGVIGTKLVEQLLSAGHSVRVVDLLAPPALWSGDVDYVQGDIVDLGPNVVSDFDPHVVYHLAAAFERSDEAPEFWRENARHNVLVSSIVLDGATRSPSLRHYVFASSYLIYDPELYLFAEPPTAATVLHESHPINPRNATGAAKLLHEKELELASTDPTHPFMWVAARIYRVYGPSSRDVVSRWIRSAVAGEPISVYGEESRFDYVFSDDVAEGLRRLAEAGVTGIVNLASGRARTVSEVVDTLRVHFPDLVIEGPVPAESYEGSEASLERLRELTGWAPSTSLERGVASLVTHERANAARGTTSHRVRPPKALNVMITSVSHKVSIIRAVRAAFRSLNVTGEVWGADVDAHVVARPFVDHFWTMPRLDSINDQELVDFCVEHEIGLLIPTRDGELARFAALRERLHGAGVFVPIGDVESVAVSLDKLEFASRCAIEGLPAIPVFEDPGLVPAERLVVKERFGAGAKGAGIDVDATRAMELGGGMSHPIYQPFVTGEEYSVDTYVDRSGRTLGAVARRRVRVSGGESVVTSIVDDPTLCELAGRLTAAIGTRGHAVIQAIRGDDGDVLLECNSRVGGASNAAWAGGLRSVDAMVLEALNEKPPTAHAQRPLTMYRASADRFSWP